MLILGILLGIYLLIGFLYAGYILLFQGDPWYLFPINIALGPIGLAYDVYKVKKKNKRKY